MFTHFLKIQQLHAHPNIQGINSLSHQRKAPRLSLFTHLINFMGMSQRKRYAENGSFRANALILEIDSYFSIK